MTQDRPRISLRRELAKTSRGASRPAPPRTLCEIKLSQPCCQGKGYVIGADGAYACASLCRCVVECQSCFGRASRTEGEVSKPCRAPSPVQVVALINSAHIPARYAGATLEQFANFSGNGRALLADLRRWKTRFSPARGKGVPGLIIEGPVGVGKTYLLAALAKDLAELGIGVRFTDFFQLLGTLKAGFSEGKADATQLAPLIDVDVLLIDELGKGRNTDFELTVLDQLVCGRYNQSKTIIGSTNYSLTPKSAHAYNIDLERPGSGSGDFGSDRFEALEQRVGPRIFSRLREMTAFLTLSGDDLRRQCV